jgi:hypothetical protein
MSCIWLSHIYGVISLSLSLSRIMVRDANKKHEDGIHHLQEANEFALWSENDRRQRLPAITAEQREQIQQYLAILQEHALHESIQTAMNDSTVRPNTTIPVPPSSSSIGTTTTTTTTTDGTPNSRSSYDRCPVMSTHVAKGVPKE